MNRKQTAHILRALALKLKEFKADMDPDAGAVANLERVAERLEDAIICLYLLSAPAPPAEPIPPKVSPIPVRTCTVKDLTDALAAVRNPRAVLVHIQLTENPAPIPVQHLGLIRDGGGAVSRLILYDTPKERML